MYLIKRPQIYSWIAQPENNGLFKDQTTNTFCGTCISYESRVQTCKGLNRLHIRDRYTYTSRANFLYSRYLKWNTCDWDQGRFRVNQGQRSWCHAINSAWVVSYSTLLTHHRICRRIWNNGCQILMNYEIFWPCCWFDILEINLTL